MRRRGVGAMVVGARLLAACGDEATSGNGAGTAREVATAPAFAECEVATGVFDIAGSPSDAVATTSEPVSVSDRDAIAAAMDGFFDQVLETFPTEYPDAPDPYEFVELADGDGGRRILMIGADDRTELDVILEPYGPAGRRVAGYTACQEILTRFNPGTDGPEATFAEVDDPEG